MVLFHSADSGLSPHQDTPTHFPHFWACFCHYVTLHTTLAAGPRKSEPSPQSNWFQWGAPARIQIQTSCCCFLAVSAWQAKIPDRFFKMDLSEHKWTPLMSHLNFLIPLPNSSWASRLPPGEVLLPYFSQCKENQGTVTENNITYSTPTDSLESPEHDQATWDSGLVLHHTPKNPTLFTGDLPKPCNLLQLCTQNPHFTEVDRSIQNASDLPNVTQWVSARAGNRNQESKSPDSLPYIEQEPLYKEAARCIYRMQHWHCKGQPQP